MNDKFGHLHSRARRVAEEDDASRVEWIRKPLWIEHPAATRIQNRIQEIFNQPKSDRMENILFIAESGLGKTSIMNRFEKWGPSDFGQNLVKRRPVIKILMPPDPTEKEFFEHILRELSIPYVKLSHMSGPRLRSLAIEVLQRCHTRVLMIDEINSLLVGTPRQQRMFLQVLRFMSNCLGVALVCAGTPEAKYALNSDRQLHSRFSEVELAPWTVGPDLQGFVNRMVQSMPLRQPSPVESSKICRLLVERSGGITSHICWGLRRAAIAAILDGREMIDLAGLQDDRIWAGVTPPLCLPFRVDRTTAGIRKDDL